MNAAAEPRLGPHPGQPAARQNTSASQNTAALLARFVHYTSALMEADKDIAPQLLVRQLNGIVPCQRAALVQLRPKVKLLSVSSGNEQLRNSAYIQQLNKTAKKYRNERAIQTPASNGSDNQLLWLPLSNNEKLPQHALWLERPGAHWSEAEQAILLRAKPFFVRALQRQKNQTSWVRRSGWLTAAALTAAIGFWPVTQSAVATAEIVASNPEYIYAPLSGVVRTVHVNPGDTIANGQQLLSYDARLLQQQALESSEAIGVAIAELTRLQAAGFRDAQARASIPVQQLKLTQSRQAAAYYENQLGLAEVKATTAGQVVLDNAERLEGAAVQMGELLLSIADPAKSELRLRIPVKDRGLVAEGAKVKLRLDSQPFSTFDATISRISYDVTTLNDEPIVVEAYASWETAKSESDSPSLERKRRANNAGTSPGT